MSYCSNCGAYIPVGEIKCLACGYMDSTALGIAADKNIGESDTSEKTGVKSSALGERLVTRYSSKRRDRGKGAVRRYSSKRKSPQTRARGAEDNNTEK